MKYTVVLLYDEDSMETYVTTVQADNPKIAAEAAKIIKDVEVIGCTDDDVSDLGDGYIVVAVFEGSHEDVYPHNE